MSRCTSVSPTASCLVTTLLTLYGRLTGSWAQGALALAAITVSLNYINLFSSLRASNILATGDAATDLRSAQQLAQQSACTTTSGHQMYTTLLPQAAHTPGFSRHARFIASNRISHSCPLCASTARSPSRLQLYPADVGYDGVKRPTCIAQRTRCAAPLTLG